MVSHFTCEFILVRFIGQNLVVQIRTVYERDLIISLAENVSQSVIVG
jgi:hypothetical protein